MDALELFGITPPPRIFLVYRHEIDPHPAARTPHRWTCIGSGEEEEAARRQAAGETTHAVVYSAGRELYSNGKAPQLAP